MGAMNLGKRVQESKAFHFWKSGKQHKTYIDGARAQEVKTLILVKGIM